MVERGREAATPITSDWCVTRLVIAGLARSPLVGAQAFLQGEIAADPRRVPRVVKCCGGVTDRSRCFF